MNICLYDLKQLCLSFKLIGDLIVCLWCYCVLYIDLLGKLNNEILMEYLKFVGNMNSW